MNINDTKITLPNVEKSIFLLTEFSFDSSQGLIVYRTVSTTGAVTVLDGANVDAGGGISNHKHWNWQYWNRPIHFSVDNTVVRTTGNQTLAGNKTFSGTVTTSSVLNVRGNIDLADNDILRLGSGDDAELFTNGQHLYLDLNSGINNFIIRDGTTTRYTFNDNGNFTATGSINGTFNTSNVRTAIAAGTAGQVGTMCFLASNHSVTITPDGTRTGVGLQYASAAGNTATNPGGTWRCMSRSQGSSGNYTEQQATLWLRYV